MAVKFYDIEIGLDEKPNSQIDTSRKLARSKTIVLFTLGKNKNVRLHLLYCLQIYI